MNLDVIEKSIKEIKSMMLAYATDGRTEEQPQEYQEAYIDLDIKLASRSHALRGECLVRRSASSNKTTLIPPKILLNCLVRAIYI